MREYDMPVEEQITLLVREFRTFKESVETRFDSIDTKLELSDAKLAKIDEKVDRVQTLLEDTHAIGKLGLEGLQGLRESTDERFASAAKTNAEQIGLLKSVVVHVRTRVEQPKGRRRS